MYTNSREGRGKAVGGGGWRRQAVKRFSHLEFFNYTSTPMERTVCQVNTVHGIQWREILEGQFLLVGLFSFSTFYNSHEMLVRKYSVLYFEYDGYCGTSLYCRGDDRDLSTVVFWLSTWPHVFNMISQLFHSRNPLLNSCRLLNFRLVTLQK